MSAAPKLDGTGKVTANVSVATGASSMADDFASDVQALLDKAARTANVRPTDVSLGPLFKFGRTFVFSGPQRLVSALQAEPSVVSVVLADTNDALIAPTDREVVDIDGIGKIVSPRPR